LNCILDGKVVPALPPTTENGFPSASVEQVEAALSTAWRVHAHSEWSAKDLQERCALLSKAHDELQSVEEKMASIDAQETGIPVSVTRMIDGSLKGMFSSEALENFSKELQPKQMNTVHGALTQTMKSFGPAIIIAPWNVPSGTVAPKVLAALLSGCPVIVKPSEVAPTGLEYFLCALNSQLPAGVLQCVHGGAEIGEMLISDERTCAIHFTGSASVGQAVAASCAKRMVPLAMECGGSNVAIVLEDANLDLASAAVSSGITMLNGQWCAGISRIFAHKSVADSFLQKLLAQLGMLKIGPAMGDATEFGPLSHLGHKQKIEAICEQLVKRGGRIQRADGTSDKMPEGNYFPPTVVDGIEDDKDVSEIFGPLATLHTFTDPAEAVLMANRKAMLQSYIFGTNTENTTRLGRTLRCGNVMINGVGFGWELSEGSEEPAFSFFGGAGLGQEAGIGGLLKFFAGAQNVGVNGK